jgi:hypothetical protein
MVRIAAVGLKQLADDDLLEIEAFARGTAPTAI